MSNLRRVATGAIRTASSSTGRVAPPATSRVAPPATSRVAPPATSRVAPPTTASSSTGRVAPPTMPPSAPSSVSLNDVARFLQGWRQHADRHYTTQDQLAELMVLLKEIKMQVSKADVVTRRETILHFTAKVEEIYFDHASWGPNERRTVEAAGVTELRELHGGSPLSEEAQAWVNASLTPLLCTRRTELRIRLDQGLISDFESLSPRLSLSEYKSMLSQDSARVDSLIRDAIQAAEEYTHDDHPDDYEGPTHDAKSIKWWCDWVRNGCSMDAKGHNVCKFPSIEKKYGAVEKGKRKNDNYFVTTGNDDTFTTTGNDDMFTTTGNDDMFTMNNGVDSDLLLITNNGDDGNILPTTNNGDDGDLFPMMINGDDSDILPTSNTDNTFATSTLDQPMNSAQCGVTTRSAMRDMIKQLSHVQVIESASSLVVQQKKLTPAEKRKATIARKKAEAEAERKKVKKRVARVVSKKGDDEEDRQMRSKKRRKIDDDSDDNEEEKDDNEEEERLVRKKNSSKKRKNSKKSDDDDGSDGLGNDRKKKKKKKSSDGEEEDIGKKKKKKKTTTPASVVARSKAPSPTDCWAVGLLECDVEDPYTTALAKTANPSIMKLVVRDDFFGKEGLRVKVLEQLEADNAEWSGATDREKALFLFFEGQRRWTVDGTPVYLGRC